MTTAPPPIRSMQGPGARPGAAAASGSPTGSTLDPVKLLKQYYPYLILAAMLGTGLGVAAHFALLKLSPRYTSTVVFECLDPLPGGESPQRQSQGRDEQERFVGTQVNLLESRVVQEAALDSRDIRDTKWAKQYLDEKGAVDKNAALRQLAKDLSARPLPQSNLIQLRMQTSDPTDAMILVNAIAYAYIADHRKNIGSTSSEHRRVLEDQAKKLDEDIRRMKGEREQVLKDAKLDATQSGAEGPRAAYEAVTLTLNETKASLDSVKSQLQNFQQRLRENQGNIFTDDLKEEAQRDSVVQGYEQKLATMRDNLGALRKQGVMEKHPDIVSIKAQIAECETQAANKLQEVLRRLSAAQLTQIENAYRSLDAQRAGLEAERGRLSDERQAIAQAQVRVQSLDREIASRSEDLAKSQASLRNIVALSSRAGENAQAIGDRVRIISSGVIPKGVSFPKLTVIVPAAMVFVTGLVGGFLFLREILDQRVRGPSDAAMVPRVKVLGLVPDAAEDPSRPTAIETVFRDNPTGVLTESFRQMRAPLIQAMERSGHRSLVVLGCMPGSGATSVASNLALAVAGADERVLVIDANFRRPAMHRVFKVSEGPGLGDILAGTTSLDQAIQNTSNEYLKVLSSGSASSRAIPERLAGEAMSRLLLEAATRFDIIIVDVPPAVVSGDGYALANKCDASIIVVRAMVEKRGLLARVRNQIGESRAEFVGVVVNAVRASAGGYFKRNIKATHAYQASAK